MVGLRKRCRALAVAALVGIPLGSALAQDRPEHRPEDRLESLLAELASPDTENWQGVEAEIVRIWSQSGSDAMDLLLQRGHDAMEAEDYMAAVEHFTALTDHAPDFAEGWNARATAFYVMGEHALSLADIERTLALNPSHFGALSGLAIILEELGEPELALEAHRAVEAINPRRAEAVGGVHRLERMLGKAEL
jgi:tetratricopeptide (TPR) repeat protein